MNTIKKKNYLILMKKSLNKKDIPLVQTNILEKKMNYIGKKNY